MVRLIARVVGVGVETADMLVNEVFSRHLRDRKPVARYAGLTGSPDERGKRRRQRGVFSGSKRTAPCPMVSSPHGRWARHVGGLVLVHDFMVDNAREGPPFAAWYLLGSIFDNPDAVCLTPAYVEGVLRRPAS